MAALGGFDVRRHARRDSSSGRAHEHVCAAVNAISKAMVKSALSEGGVTPIAGGQRIKMPTHRRYYDWVIEPGLVLKSAEIRQSRPCTLSADDSNLSVV